MNDLQSLSLNFSPNLSKFSAAFLSCTFKINYQCAATGSLLSAPRDLLKESQSSSLAKHLCYSQGCLCLRFLLPACLLPLCPREGPESSFGLKREWEEALRRAGCLSEESAVWCRRVLHLQAGSLFQRLAGISHSCSQGVCQIRYFCPGPALHS